MKLSYVAVGIQNGTATLENSLAVSSPETYTYPMTQQFHS